MDNTINGINTNVLSSEAAQFIETIMGIEPIAMESSQQELEPVDLNTVLNTGDEANTAIYEPTPSTEEPEETEQEIDNEADVEEPQQNEDTSTEPESVVDNSIRPNSNTLLVDESSSRFSGAIWADKIREQEPILAGVGGIGSYVAFLLSRVKPSSITIYDPDRVDSTNMSGQLYSTNDVNEFKVNAMGRMMGLYSNHYNVRCYNIPYDAGALTSDIMICGFDNMAARALFYRNWIRHVSRKSPENKKKCLFIDGRLAAEELQVFCIKGDDGYHMRQYEDKWLFSDEEAEETQCSYKQTSHCANMIASVMVNLFVNFIANQCEPLIDRDVPFMTSYDASTMYFKTVS